jgi:hypothetical protein
MIRAWILWTHIVFGDHQLLRWGVTSHLLSSKVFEQQIWRQWVHSLAWIFFASRNPYGSCPVATVPIMNWASIQWIMRFSYGFCFNSEIVYRLIWSWDWHTWIQFHQVQIFCSHPETCSSNRETPTLWTWDLQCRKGVKEMPRWEDFAHFFRFHILDIAGKGLADHPSAF